MYLQTAFYQDDLKLSQFTETNKTERHICQSALLLKTSFNLWPTALLKSLEMISTDIQKLKVTIFRVIKPDSLMAIGR